MTDIIPEDGIFPDLETILSKIPEGNENTKLYISADVDYIEDDLVISDNKLEELEEIFRKILSKIGKLLRLENSIFDDWIENQISGILYNNSNAIYTIASMTVSDPEIRYQMLECNDEQSLYDMLLEQLDVIQI